MLSQIHIEAELNLSTLNYTHLCNLHLNMLNLNCFSYYQLTNTIVKQKLLIENQRFFMKLVD